jgi:hypothetical protein
VWGRAAAVRIPKLQNGAISVLLPVQKERSVDAAVHQCYSGVGLCNRTLPMQHGQVARLFAPRAGACATQPTSVSQTISADVSHKNCVHIPPELLLT